MKRPPFRKIRHKRKALPRLSQSRQRSFTLVRALVKMSDVLLTDVGLFADRHTDRKINRVAAVRLPTSIGWQGSIREHRRHRGLGGMLSRILDNSVRQGSPLGNSP